MNIKIEGKGGISCEVIKDSINCWWDRLTTLEIKVHRFIWSELMTHRVFSRNAASSRAIPVEKNISYIQDNPAIPIHWGLNQPGMQANKEVDEEQLDHFQSIWLDALRHNIASANELWNGGKGLHKQIVNRLLEPFTMMKAVVSATEWNNFLWLRNHSAAQPEIEELAKVISGCLRESKPKEIRYGQYHLPYVTEGDLRKYSLEQCMSISVSCCAQVSYRNLDTSIEKANKVYNSLTSGDRIHASPYEHQATPFKEDEYMARSKCKRLFKASVKDIYSESVADTLSDQMMYCGNLRGWTQKRKTLENEFVNK